MVTYGKELTSKELAKDANRFWLIVAIVIISLLIIL